jgi:hypothetical protein
MIGKSPRALYARPIGQSLPMIFNGWRIDISAQHGAHGRVNEADHPASSACKKGETRRNPTMKLSLGVHDHDRDCDHKLSFRATGRIWPSAPCL